MDQGTLTEISPFGTGFIESEDGRVLGFHHTMLAVAVARDQWPTLSNKIVVFELRNGVAQHVCLSSKRHAQSAASGSR